MQQPHSGFAHLGIKYITQARDKQGHTCWAWPPPHPDHPCFSISRLGRAQPTGIPIRYLCKCLKRLQTLLFVLVNLSEQLLELLGQAIDFTLCTAQALSVEVLQRDIAEKDPQENA